MNFANLITPRRTLIAGAVAAAIATTGEVATQEPTHGTYQQTYTQDQFQATNSWDSTLQNGREVKAFVTGLVESRDKVELGPGHVHVNEARFGGGEVTPQPTLQHFLTQFDWNAEGNLSHTVCTKTGCISQIGGTTRPDYGNLPSLEGHRTVSDSQGVKSHLAWACVPQEKAILCDAAAYVRGQDGSHTYTMFDSELGESASVTQLSTGEFRVHEQW